ncbi:hypothetical protein KIH74_05695 [Kineosporia sp. J2-2]|uniref:Uncharacterized protein n=1 Tax=Kineosporia corallincola TaxID=2835133 RepID=A0ABS5TBF8_9ACTN|nr:hypothetical protein [Kineosporia corallincola]MBT0768407.1 hypothetical protein [Kineosporia corallincola]
MTVLLSAGDVHGALDLEALAHGSGHAQRRSGDLPAEGTATLLFPGLAAGSPPPAGNSSSPMPTGRSAPSVAG